MSEQTRTDDDRVERDDYETNPDESGKWVSALIALLGGWMIVEAFLLDIVLTQFWNDVLVGALLLAVGGYNYYRRSDAEVGSMAAAGIAALLGLWLIVAPFVLGAAGDATAVDAVNDLAFWNDTIAGAIALLLGLYSAYEIRKDSSEARRATSADH
jgi:thiol:disulfide interchange protein